MAFGYFSLNIISIYSVRHHKFSIFYFGGPRNKIEIKRYSRIVDTYAAKHMRNLPPLHIPLNNSVTRQTSAEISFLGSPINSIFYSIARFFYQTAILCCHKNPVANSLQGSK